MWAKRENMVKKTFIAFAGAVLLAGGCSLLEQKPPEQVVASRAQKRVDLLMEGDFERAYIFTTPGYRTTEGVGRYGTRWAGTQMWLSARVEEVVCRAGNADLGPPDRCQVLLRVTYTAPGMGLSETTLSEDWILTEGNWYLYQKF
jgi:hypothetical protein